MRKATIARYIFVIFSKIESKTLNKTNFPCPSGNRLMIIALKAGESVMALSEEMRTAKQIVRANCLYIAPVRPGMRETGTKTATKTRVVAMIGPISWSIASLTTWGMVNSGRSPIILSTFSTTRITSSTTMPMARISPNKVRKFMEKPAPSSIPKVPTSDTGIATAAIIVGRQDPRKIKTIRMTRATAIARFCTTFWIATSTNSVVS